jgi:DNA gyrase/topoisomerase IV subunit B
VPGLPVCYLRDCVSKDPAECTLLLVQTGPLYEAAVRDRDRLTEAVLGIDDSVGRVAGLDLGGILDNESVKSVVAALGAGICVDGADLLDMSKLRYHRIVIVVEDTPLGKEVEERTLELFDTVFRPILAAGHVTVKRTE